MTETYEPPTTHVTPREGGNLPRCVQTPEETALLLPSTEIDTIRQSPTNRNENSCPRVHARTRARQRRSFSFLSAWIQRIGRIAWRRRPSSIVPIHQTEPALEWLALDMPATPR